MIGRKLRHHESGSQFKILSKLKKNGEIHDVILKQSIFLFRQSFEMDTKNFNIAEKVKKVVKITHIHNEKIPTE